MTSQKVTDKTMDYSFKYRNITISGRVAVGTSTLAKKLKEILGWKYINAGELQRQYDREHNIKENQRGAVLRPDEHEREIDEIPKDILETENHVIYEAWLAGFMAKDIEGVLKVLLICSNNAIRIDRVANRDKVSIEDAKHFLKTREEENVEKWKKLYGNYDFWNEEYYDLVIDTYGSGPMETAGKVLDKLGYKSLS